MSLYLDTSLLVSVLTPESSTAKSQDWLDGYSIEELAISDWVVTEFSAALSIKARTGQLASEQRARVLTAVASLVAALASAFAPWWPGVPSTAMKIDK